MLKRGRKQEFPDRRRAAVARVCVVRALHYCLAAAHSLLPHTLSHAQDISAIAQDTLNNFDLVVPGVIAGGAIVVSFTNPLLSKFLYNFVRDPALGLAPDDAVRLAYVLKHCSEIKHSVSTWGSAVSAS